MPATLPKKSVNTTIIRRGWTTAQAAPTAGDCPVAFAWIPPNARGTARLLTGLSPSASRARGAPPSHPHVPEPESPEDFGRQSVAAVDDQVGRAHSLADRLPVQA